MQSNNIQARKRARVVFAGKSVVMRGALTICAATLASTTSTLADNECGSEILADPSDTVTCNGLSYSNGIAYFGSDGLNLILENSNMVIGSPGVRLFSSATAIGDVSIIGREISQITAGANFVSAISTLNTGSGNSNVSLEADAAIRTTGVAAHGIASFISSNAQSTGTATSTMIAGDIQTRGGGAIGAYAENRGGGDANVIVRGGSITTEGTNAQGAASYLLGTQTLGQATVNMIGGSIEARSAFGIVALNQGSGSATVTVSGGDITSGADGAASIVQNVTSEAAATATMTGGTIVSARHGLVADQSGLGDPLASLEDGTISSNGYGVSSRIFNATSEATTTVIMRGGTVNARQAGGGGLRAINLGTGDAIISALTGSIQLSDDTVGIRTSTTRGGTSQITVGNDMTIGRMPTMAGGSPNPIVAILNNEGNSEVVSRGSVTGDAVLGLGNDSFTLESGIYDGDIYGDDERALGLSFDDFVLLYAGLFTEEQLRGVNPIDGVGQNDLFTWSGGTFASSFFGGNGSDAANITTSSYDGAYHVLDGGDDYTAADGWVDVLTLSGDVSGRINGANLRNWERINFDGVEISIVDRALRVGADQGQGLFLRNGTLLDQSGASFTLTGNLTNAATLNMQGGSTGDSVRVVGNYTGQEGILLLDVDTSTGTSDMLAVTGSTSGRTNIVVDNLSPNLASGNAMLLVSVGGDSAENDFVLPSQPLIAGAFQYDLRYQPGGFVLAPTLSATGAVYEVAPHVILEGLARLPTLEQRVGQRERNVVGETVEQAAAAWVRASGDRSEIAFETGTSYDADSWGLQAGYDLPIEQGGSGQWILGLTVQAGEALADVRTTAGTGSISAEGLGIGATATWYGYNNLYLDFQSQLNWALVDYASSLHGPLASDELVRTASFSMEAGYNMTLDANRRVIPQAQLTWSEVNGVAFSDSASNAVDIGVNDRWNGRLGVAYDYEWMSANGIEHRNIYGVANLVHEFSSNSSVNVSGASLSTSRNATWGEIGLGGSYDMERQTGSSTSFYGEVTASREFSGSKVRGLAGTIGVRIDF